MSTAFWEGINHITFPPTGNVQVFDPKWKETQCLVEITHVSGLWFMRNGKEQVLTTLQQLGLLQELLYYTPDLTSDLIRTRRYEPILHRLKPEIDSLWQFLARGLSEYDVLEESVSGNEEEEIREIRMRLEVDYLR